MGSEAPSTHGVGGETPGLGDRPLVAGHWPRDVLVVRGVDAVQYLQGQLSADVVTLEPGQSTLALMLEPNGKVAVLLRLWRTDENVFVIDTDRGAGGATEARLRRFLLRMDVAIEATEWDSVILRGGGAMDWAERLEGTGAELVGLGMWPGIDGLDLLGPAVSVPDGITEASGEALEALRIRAGWPAFGAEIMGGVIPAEVGPWLITAAVSFTKGCYVGQELTARIHSRGGNVPRHLRGFEVSPGRSASAGDDIVVLASAESAPSPSEHRAPEREEAPERETAEPTPGDAKVGSDRSAVGTVTSAVLDPFTGTTVALGYVKRVVEDGARLGVP